MSTINRAQTVQESGRGEAELTKWERNAKIKRKNAIFYFICGFFSEAG